MKSIICQLILITLYAMGSSPAGYSAEVEQNVDVHAHHHMMQQTKSQMVGYTLPQIRLVRDDGKNVSFTDELNDGRPVVMNFMYTSCTTICPLTSQTLSELQDKLGKQRDRIHIMSISIDPEQDTTAVLTKYAKRFEAGTEWNFYTGTRDASIAAQKAFNVYRGDKMEHNPVTFIRSAPGKMWERIDGFAKSDELLKILQDLQASADDRTTMTAY